MFQLQIQSNRQWYIVGEYTTHEAAETERQARVVAANANWTFPPKMRIKEVS